MENTKTFIVVRDGEIDKELSVIPKKPGLKEHVSSLTAAINLQLEMIRYDLVHGTNYRKIRNDLVREKRNRAFEARIGIERTK